MNGSSLDALVLSLTLTLLHVLWIGVVIAVADGVVAWGLRRATASSRYVTHVAALVLLALSLPGTFAVVAPAPAPRATSLASGVASTRAESPPTRVPIVIADNPAAELPVLSTPVETKAARTTNTSAQFLATAAPYVTAAYLFGVAVMLARLGVGLWGGRRLRLSGRAAMDSELLGMATRQGRRIGLRLVPVVAWCDRIAVPIVVGILKPTILLPASLATGFEPRQLELLLAHELAHVRRFDLWINLLQRLVEAVLFFHPAAWYLSRRVSLEREIACDDLVLAGGNGRVQYAEALLQVAERSFALRGLPGNAVFVAATGESPTQFKRRILRLLQAEGTPRPQLTGRGVLMGVIAGGLLLGSLAMFSAEGGVGAEDVQESPTGEQPAKRQPVADDDPAARATAKHPEHPAGKVPIPVAGEVLTVDSDTQHVTISLGADDRLARGHRLSVYRPGKQGDPLILVGEIEVVRLAADQAEARIVSSEEAVKAGDRVSSRQFSPAFSKLRNGIAIGLAIASERTKFRHGERVPLALVIRNVSDKPLDISHGLYPPETPPNVVGPDGKPIEIEKVILLGSNRRYQNTLQPKEAAVYTHLGLGLGKNPDPSKLWHPFLKEPAPGKYTLSQELRVTVSGEGREAEGLRATTGEVTFEIALNDAAPAAPRNPLRGQEATDRIKEFPPAFSPPRAGIEMGIAIASKRTKFRAGERVPLDFVIRNVGDKPRTVQFRLYPVEHPPNVIGPHGQPIPIESVTLLGGTAPTECPLEPNEVVVYRHNGLGLGEGPHPFLKDAAPGRYKLSQRVQVGTFRGVQAGETAPPTTTGEVEFEIVRNEQPAQDTTAPAAQDAQPKEPETNRVVDAQGKPIPQAKLELLPYVLEPKDVLATFTADDQGRFDYPKETPETGHFYLQVSAPGFVTDKWIGNFEVHRNKPREFRLSRVTTISGRVLGTDGKPLAGVSLGLDSETSRAAILGRQHLKSDAEGRFQFEDLPSGEFYIRYQDTPVPLPVRVAIVKVTAKDGENVSDVTLDLSKATGVVEGRVFDARDQGIANAHIQVHLAIAQRLDHSTSTKTGDDGRFRVEGLLPGEYQVRAMGSLIGGGLGHPQMVTVKPDKPASVMIAGYTGGQPPPKDRKVEPKWGPTHEGLQAALVFDPAQPTYTAGDVVKVQALVRNVTKEPIEFKDTHSFNDLEVTLPDKQVVHFNYLMFTGLPWSELYRLDPGNELVLKGAFQISLSGKDGAKGLFDLPVESGQDYKFLIRFGTSWNDVSGAPEKQRVSGEAVLRVK